MVALIPIDAVSYFRTVFLLFFFTVDPLSIDMHCIVEGFFFVISDVFYFPPSDPLLRHQPDLHPSAWH